mgnify:CR=1 FL=1
MKLYKRDLLQWGHDIVKLKDSAERERFVQSVRSKYDCEMSPEVENLLCCSHSQHIEESLWHPDPGKTNIMNLILYIHEECVALLRLYIVGGARATALKKCLKELDQLISGELKGDFDCQIVNDPVFMRHEAVNQFGSSVPRQYNFPIPLTARDELQLQNLLEVLIEHRAGIFRDVVRDDANGMTLSEYIRSHHEVEQCE